jgi:hypothetical protein
MLYNILIYASSIKNVLDKIIPLNNKGYYELELKFKTNKIDFNDYITYLKTVNNLTFTTTVDTVYSYDFKKGETFRKIVVPSYQIEYMKKDGFLSFYFKNFIIFVFGFLS